MKFMLKKFVPEPSLGTVRTREKFLWIPRIVRDSQGYHVAWLMTVKCTEVYTQLTSLGTSATSLTKYKAWVARYHFY